MGASESGDRGMDNLSLRLPDDVQRRLEAEAKLTHRKRSEVAREAIAEYLHRQERDRFIAEFMAEARAYAKDPRARRESRELAEEWLVADNEALDIAEGREPGEPWPEDNERWWEK
jgi:predicted transcriptional regulator